MVGLWWDCNVELSSVAVYVMYLVLVMCARTVVKSYNGKIICINFHFIRRKILSKASASH